MDSYTATIGFIKKFYFPLLAILSVFILYYSDFKTEILSQYLGLHTIFEILSISVSLMIFTFQWSINTKKQQAHVAFSAATFLAVTLLDLFHTLSYKGMPDFISPNGYNKSIDFWLCARFMQTLTFVLTAFLPNKAISRAKSISLMIISLLFVLVTSTLIFYHIDKLPIMLIEGVGLRPVKIYSEMFLVFCSILSGIVFYRRYLNGIERQKNTFLINASLMMIATGLCFSLFTIHNDMLNFWGHILKISTYAFIYKAILELDFLAPYHQLEEKVIERTATLTDKTLQLEAANKELEAFSYSVSHDLRAPLRGIDGWSLALKEDYAQALDETGKGYIDRVRKECHRMSDLIDNLLKLAKIVRTETIKKEFDLSSLAESVKKRLLEEYKEKEIHFIIAPDLKIMGDSNLFEILLTNLFSNSCKFTSKISQPKIELGKTVINNSEVYFIRDNGAGFNSQSASNLFGAFQRMHKTSEFPGTGIGLAIVKRIINAHNGTIWAESEVNKGAVFYFSI